MKNRLIVILFAITLASGCSTTKTVSFKVTEKGQKFTYQMQIRKGYTVKDMNYENERAKIFL